LKLIPFSSQYLRPKEALPFGVRDSSGCLLLAAGQLIGSVEQLAHLQSLKLFADEAESSEWRRRLAAAMDSMVRQNASLKDIVAARPADETRESKVRDEATLPEQWEDLASTLDATLRDARPGGDWLQRVGAVHEQSRRLATRRLDASLYYLIYSAGHSVERYAGHHSLLAMVVCEHACGLLGWPPELVDAIGRAALTMNVAMVRLQDLLAQSDLKPTAEMRAEIDAHAARGAALLLASGADDAVWCDAVRFHHDHSDAELPLEQLPPGRRVARLLRRVDIFTAKLSRRKTRVPMSPVQAAKEACLGANGTPDEIGASLLKAVGLYPPGSFVQLASGELGVVVSRGRRANLPLVASLVTPSGSPMGEPTLRDTVEPRFAVRGAVASATVKVRPTHARVLALL
jgi:HD-GYP domain-containing protein (c-di-GMP phosphodiesterase class II)